MIFLSSRFSININSAHFIYKDLYQIQYSQIEKLNRFNLNKQMPNGQENTMYSVKCGIASFIATYIAGVMHPLDLIKTRFQSHDGKSNSENQVPKYEGVLKGLRQIYKNQGFKGLYKGFYISLLSQAMATGFFFWLYEKRKKHYENKGLEAMHAVTYSSIEASIVATLVTQPVWVIKTRMLLNTQKNIGQIQHAIKKAKQVYEQNGIRGYLKGLGVSLVLSFSGVLQMYLYEGSKILYESVKIPESKFSEKHFICGSMSKFVAILITYPLTTIRTRIQQNQYFNNRSKAKYSNALDASYRLVRDEGISGFYKGLIPNLMKGIPQRGIYFYFYELFKHIFLGSPKETTS